MSETPLTHRLKTSAWRIAGAPATLLAAMPVDVFAHTRERPTPETLWSSWNLDPLIAIGLLLGTWLYLRGVAALWRSAGTGSIVQRWQVWAFAGGFGSLLVALVSPLDALGAALFSAHMVQHVILFLLAPMLFAAARPETAMAWAIPVPYRKAVLSGIHRQPVVRGVRSLLSNPVAIWMLFTGILWIWHVPALYDAALRSDLVHQVEHLSFLLAAFLFWSWLLRSSAGRSSRGGLAVLFVFTSVIQSGLLGAILTFAGTTLYEGHLPYTEAWSLTGIEDQQLAGLIMWIPMGLWFTATIVFVFVAWLRDADRSVRRWESQDDREPSTAGEPATIHGR